MKRTRRTALHAMACLALMNTAWAQTNADAYPSKPIRVVVPFVAGGGGDNQARLILTRVSLELGQSFIFENVAGAGGNVGAQAVTRANPDGYTLLYGTNGTHGINHALYKNTGFNPRKDFEPVGRLSSIPAMLVVRPGLAATNVTELVKLLKAKPGSYSFASAGNGTTSHLTGEMFKAQAGVDAVHVPYKGGAPAMIDLIGGRVDFMIDVMPNTAPQVRGERVKALAVTSAQRLGSFPAIPTLMESGLEGFQVSAWDAVFAPAGTPAAIVEKLNAAINKALNDPELRKQLASRGSEVYPSSSAELGRFIGSEMERWGMAVKRSGAAID
jgi:tripartite-type tricarboxylate transporter receptor subunit TctC